MSDLNTDIIRSLLNELINKVNETKGDQKNQKQNDLIINALKDLSDKTVDNKINIEEFAKELSQHISDKLIPVMKQTSEEQIEATKETSEEVQHSSNTNNPGSGGSGRNGGGGGGNTINPDATEPERELGRAASGAAKSLSGMSKVVNVAAKGVELGLIALAGVSTEAKKGLDNTFKSFSQISDVGVSFNGSATEMREAAAASGMSLEQFTKSVTSSSNTFRTLSPDQISRFNRSVVDASNSMQGLALTTDQRQEYENDYMTMVASQGQTQQQTTESVQQGFVNLVKTSRDLSTVFGDSATSIAKAASDFLKSRDGFTSATMLTRNQANVQTVATTSRELFNNLGIKQELQNAILTAAATGIRSPELLRYMSASQGNAEQIRALTDGLGQIIKSNDVVSGRLAAQITGQTIRRVANTRTNYDNASINGRAIMSTYHNENYDNNISGSQTAMMARNYNTRNINERINQTDQSATRPDQTLANSVQANRIETQDLAMAHDAAQTQAMVRFQNTIRDGLNLYHNSVTESTNFLNNNSKSLSHNTSLLDKFGDSLVKTIGSLSGSHAVIGGATIGGEVLHDMFSSLGGALGAGGLLLTSAFSRHSGGVAPFARQLSKQLSNLSKIIPNIGKSTVSRTVEDGASNFAESGSSSLSRVGGAASKILPGVGRLGGGLVAGGLSAFELMNNYNDYKEGKETHDQWKKNNYEEVGSGVGGVAGATLGSIVGPLGTIAGGIAGAYIGKTLGEVGYNLFNSHTAQPKNSISKPLQTLKNDNVDSYNKNQFKLDNLNSEKHFKDTNSNNSYLISSDNYLKNIDKNIELIKNIINPSDLLTNQLLDNSNNPTNINNVYSNDINNDFTDTKATNKTEADLDSLVKGIEAMMVILENISNHISTNVIETQTQNTMIHDLLNRLNNNVKQISQKPTNSLNR